MYDLTQVSGEGGFPVTVLEVLKPSESITFSPIEEDCFVALTSVSLDIQAIGATATGSSTLYATYKGTKIALCTLRAGGVEQATLPQIFANYECEDEEETPKMTLSCEGSFPLHVFAMAQEEEDTGAAGGCGDAQDPAKMEAMLQQMMGGGDEEEFDSEEDEDEDDDLAAKYALQENTMKNSGPTVEQLASSDEEGSEEEETVTLVSAEKVEVETKVIEPEATPTKKTDKVVNPVIASDESPKLSKSQKRKLKKQKDMESKAAASPAKKEEEKVVEVVKKADKKRPVTETANSKSPLPVAKKSKRVVAGVTIQDLQVGQGPTAKKGKNISLLYKGKLENGKQFDSCQNKKSPFSFRVGTGQVIKGMDIGVDGMRVGGKRTITIPSKLGYGRAGAGKDIPPNSTLVFELELLSA